MFRVFNYIRVFIDYLLALKISEWDNNLVKLQQVPITPE